MHTIFSRNPNFALIQGLDLLLREGKLSINARTGQRVLRAPMPVTTRYSEPTERVVFHATRDANPFFHLYEALWMLGGRNDAASVAQFAKQMESFADDGIMWGAYGYRWRGFFGFDQLPQLIAQMRLDGTTRRAVLSMWSPVGDLVPVEGGAGGPFSKDVPCNTHIYFDPTQGVMDMTVCNRSNDIVWGAYGANVVHMSILQEFMAAAVGIPVGAYYQVSNNYHVYIDRPDIQRLVLASPGSDRSAWRVLINADDRYEMGLTPVRARPLLSYGESWEDFLAECAEFAAEPYGRGWSFNFLHSVAGPMMRAHRAFKSGLLAEAAAVLEDADRRLPGRNDWLTAAGEWIARRAQKAVG